jgi:hypothetical protein
VVARLHVVTLLGRLSCLLKSCMGDSRTSGAVVCTVQGSEQIVNQILLIAYPNCESSSKKDAIAERNVRSRAHQRGSKLPLARHRLLVGPGNFARWHFKKKLSYIVHFRRFRMRLLGVTTNFALASYITLKKLVVSLFICRSKILLSPTHITLH